MPCCASHTILPAAADAADHNHKHHASPLIDYAMLIIILLY